MKILVVNAGSSSLKYQLIDMDGEKELAKGLVERIGIEGSRLKQSAGDIKTEIEMAIPDHEAAAQLMLKVLQDPESGVIKSTDEIGAVGNRLGVGGERMLGPQRRGPCDKRSPGYGGQRGIQRAHLSGYVRR